MNISVVKNWALGRTFLLAGLYSLGVLLSIWLAYLLRFDFSLEPTYQVQFRMVLSWVVPLKLALLLAFGQFTGLFSGATGLAALRSSERAVNVHGVWRESVFHPVVLNDHRAAFAEH